MKYIDIPNLPDGDVSLAVVDMRIEPEIAASLEQNGIKLIKTCYYPGMYEAVACHPDIMLHHLGGKRIIYAPGTSQHLVDFLLSYGFTPMSGKTYLSPKYPLNISYNVARVGKFAFHNLKYTDPVLREELDKQAVEFVHVNQGYTKCSVSIVDKNSIITSDKGIAKIAEKKGVEVLLIDADKNIQLKGLDYGFIGGASGLIGKNKWAVAGNFEMLESAYKIYDFLNKRNIEIVSLSKGKVEDIGSIIPLKIW